MNRPTLPSIVIGIAVTVAAAAAMTMAGSALAASSAGAPARATPGRAMIAPLPGRGPRTAAQAKTAAQTCVQYATRAGWANNGYFGGYLVTAAAICVAESGGDPNLVACNPSGQSGDYPGFTCPGGTTSEDRGLWQLNSAVAGAASNTCAFNPVCNADFAYFDAGPDHGSERGTDFSPWSSYDQDKYTPFIDPVQAAVSKLKAGTVTSAELGECLAPAKSAANAQVVVVNCGTGGTLQLWSTGGGKLRSGSACAAIGTKPGVVLRSCARNRRQDWVSFGRDELRNVADGKCLTDPSGNLTAGTQVIVATCADAKDQTWWLP